MIKRNKLLFVLILALAVLAWSGCSSTPSETESSDGQEAGGKDNEPVTITVLNGNGLSEEHFRLIFEDPVKKKHPHITLEQTSTTNIDTLVTAGETPDLILTHNGNFGRFQELDLMYDMSELARKLDLDLGRFDPVVVEAMAVTGPGALNGMPYALNFSALFYNADYFDAFGVGYPEDGMTWDEAIELGKRMTREYNNMQIRGLDPYALTRFQRILGNTFYDPETNQSTLNTPEWRFIFEKMKEIISIPGNEWTDAEVRNGVSPATNFYNERNSAMYAGNNIVFNLKEPTENGLNWDVAQYPSFPERPNVYNDIDAHLTFITKASEHKEDAMKVIIETVSDETQLSMARQTARKSPLADPKFEAEFAADIDYAQGKNIAGMFKGKMINSPVRPRYTTEASNFLKEAFYQYYNGTDVNTVLSEADEKMNQFLQQASQ